MTTPHRMLPPHVVMALTRSLEMIAMQQASPDLEEVRQLLADGVLVDGLPDSRRSPLGYAIHYGHAHLAELLLAAGADPNRIDREGNAPLHQLIDGYRGRMPEEAALYIMDALLAHGAHPNLQNKSRLTALDVAAHKLQDALMLRLLAAGASVDYIDNILIRNEIGRDFGAECKQRLQALRLPDGRLDVEALTAADICLLANMDCYQQAFDPALWSGRGDSLQSLLAALPVWLSQEILSKTPNLGDMIADQLPKSVVSDVISGDISPIMPPHAVKTR